MVIIIFFFSINMVIYRQLMEYIFIVKTSIYLKLIIIYN